MALIQCSNCGQMVSDKATKCPNCGTPIVVPVKCKVCGELVSPNARACPNCGAPTKDTKKCKECGNQIPENAVTCPCCGYNNQEQQKLTFKEAISVCLLKKYATFTGRARRSEYWFFYLFNMIISIALSILMIILQWTSMYTVLLVIQTLFFIATLVPNFAVGIRRLHDTGRSGWNLLWALLPIVGLILLLIWFAQDSSKDDNKYGPSPKYN